MSSPTSYYNPEILDAAAVKENLNYIAKFKLSSNIILYIDYRLILNNFHIDDLTTTSDINLNTWVLNCLKSY